MPAKPSPPKRDEFRVFHPIATRWMDNDVYGHVNNVVYYSYFDTAVNAYLIEQGVLDIGQSEVVGLVVHTSCSYFREIAFPELLEVGLAAERVGTSSVTYRLAIFKQDDDVAVAAGQFVHVYVHRVSRTPTPLSADLRRVLEALA